MISSISLGGLILTDQPIASDYGLEQIEGWGSPSGTLEVQQRPRGHGGWAGTSYLKPRPVVLSGTAFFETPADGETMADALTAAASLGDTTLSVVEEAGTRTLTVRRDGPVVINWPPVAANIFTWSVQLVAVDPRKAGPELTGSTALPVTTGGLTFAHTFPHTFDAVTVSGQVSLTNAGNIAAPVRLRIDGPVTGPVVTHVSSGKVLTFSSSVTLASGEWIDVDMERREVLANGQSSRNSWVTGRGWSQFEPGDNTWAFTAASYSSGSRLTVTTHSAWE